MKLQDQVCILEQAKRLKKLGVDSEANFAYYEKAVGEDFESYLGDYHEKAFEQVGLYKTFTSAELEQALNSEFYTIRDGSEMSEYANWSWFNDPLSIGMGLFETAAIAKADALIYCLEKGLVTAAEVNQRLNA